MRGGRAVRAKKQVARRGRQGFTLVEVIVVLVILAVLAALLIPSMVKWIDKSHEKICQVNRSDIARFYRAALPLEPELQRDSQNGQADKVLPFLRETGYVEEGMKCPDGGTYLSLYDLSLIHISHPGLPLPARRAGERPPGGGGGRRRPDHHRD